MEKSIPREFPGTFSAVPARPGAVLSAIRLESRGYSRPCSSKKKKKKRKTKGKGTNRPSDFDFYVFPVRKKKKSSARLAHDFRPTI